MHVVAILDFRGAVSLQENRRLLERTAAAGKVRPADWRTGEYRSLTVLADGSCLLRRGSPGTLARRLRDGALPRRQEGARSAR